MVLCGLDSHGCGHPVLRQSVARAAATGKMAGFPVLVQHENKKDEDQQESVATINFNPRLGTHAFLMVFAHAYRLRGSYELEFSKPPVSLPFEQPSQRWPVRQTTDLLG